MKHLLKKFEIEGDDLSILANLEFMKEEKQISEIQFPKTVVLCSKLSMVLEKKLSYVRK